MTARRTVRALRWAGLAVALLLPLAGCAYDYLQHTDRVAYSAGDAVNANLERETVNPAKRSMFDTTGLGKNGSVVPPYPAAGGPSTSTTTATSN